MTLIAVCGTKGSPGVTTVAAVLAALSVDAGHDTLLVEADPDGGTLALDTLTPFDPGVLSLAAAARHGLSASTVRAHTQLMANGARVLLAPTAADPCRSAVASLAAAITPVIGPSAAVVVADCGRWQPATPARPLLDAADRVLVVLRPTVAGAEQARSILHAVQATAASVELVCVGERPYPPREVSACVGGVAYTTVAFDPNAAGRVTAGLPLDRWTRRSALVRSARPLVAPLGPTSCEQSRLA
jgi:MinD-like ATPase involved in chromosome partitioning or flagellar assembly